MTGGRPMKVDSFHSKKNPDVYHVCTDCTEGKDIEKKNKAFGKGGGRICNRCIKLIGKGGC